MRIPRLIAVMSGLGLKKNGYRCVKSREMIECSVMVLHADRYAFSVVGRRARMWYAAARFGRRWFNEGSAMVSVQRSRSIVLAGRLKDVGGGMGLTICDGSGLLRLWLRARVPYPNSERNEMVR